MTICCFPFIMEYNGLKIPIAEPNSSFGTLVKTARKTQSPMGEQGDLGSRAGPREVGKRAGEDRQDQPANKRPANKRLFHCPHFNWFTAFSVCLSIRAAAKWLAKALALMAPDRCRGCGRRKGRGRQRERERKCISPLMDLALL